jgi:hypothetical protein
MMNTRKGKRNGKHFRTSKKLIRRRLGQMLPALLSALLVFSLVPNFSLAGEPELEGTEPEILQGTDPIGDEEGVENPAPPLDTIAADPFDFESTAIEDDITLVAEFVETASVSTGEIGIDEAPVPLTPILPRAAAPRGLPGVAPLAAGFVVSYKVGDTAVKTVEVEPGTPINKISGLSPEAPATEYWPSDVKYFTGWVWDDDENPDTDEILFDFDSANPITSDIDLIATFTSDYLVRYHDASVGAVVIQSDYVKDGYPVPAFDLIKNGPDLAYPTGKTLDFWTLDPSAETPLPFTDATVTGDLDLYPVLTNLWYVLFDFQGGLEEESTALVRNC